ncbi:lipase/serine esteras-like protein [Melanomma pulvis-pyrius CBS 109.77]|uniref:Lipase/serine esteras-like protein n=1 Tax=Melanomma pulvis-pyrius CBS 109.77 TaxID=1314802 RepID=A0A6A6XPY4_9PLEO|nr:lipase/serine esteras-like protein [Melanomma pulvis-pyrius CBS 109.77]
MDTAAPAPTAASPDHLCVLVHGLWGNPDHLKFLSTSLRERYPEDKLHVLVAKRNAGSFTYDGIELGGERVAHEIEETLEELARSGHEIKKLSIVGYSLGGLISRYAIGLLFHKGLFQKIEPVNFTTFATPHLGVRTPLLGFHNKIWNVLGARALSMSGRQLFTIDSFRDTGRPLLAVLADPESIFMQALAQFKYRSLYANVVNDRSVSYYTAGISKVDPFIQPDEVKMNYVDGYEDVILDGENPVSAKEPEALPAFTQRLTSSTRTVFGRVPLVAFLVVFIPIGSTLFLINSAIQSVRSNQRIRMHEQGKGGFDIGGYRIPLMINGMRKEVEDMYENMNNAQEQEYLLSGSEEHASPSISQSTNISRKKSIDNASEVESIEESKAGLAVEFPTLALTPDQFAMVEALNNVGFKKHPVYIHKHRHSHAAIIRRMEKSSFDEGRIVVKHWLNEFVL